MIFSPFLVTAISVAACSNSPSLSHTHYAGAVLFNGYIAIITAKKNNILLVRSSVSYWCFSRASSKISAASHRKDVKCFCQIHALFPVRPRPPHQDLNACHRELAAGRDFITTKYIHNIPFWVENPRSRNVVCIIIIRIIYVEVHFYILLLLRAIARPKTIQIIGNTCPCRIGEPWKPCFTLTQAKKNVISLNVVPSIKKEGSKENLHEINCRMHHDKRPPFFFRFFSEKRPNIFPG